MRTFSIRDVLSFAREHTLDGIKKAWVSLACAYGAILGIFALGIVIETIFSPVRGTLLFHAMQWTIVIVTALAWFLCILCFG